MATDYSVLLAYILGIAFLFILGRIFLVPFKVVAKLFFNTLIGGVVLLIINLAGGLAGFHIAFNIVSALIVGFLGVPGLILLIVLKVLFNA